MQQLNLTESQLIPYGTVKEYHKALAQGHQNGGVAAIFDEIPYIRVFLSKYGSNFMMAGPIYRTDGFGFVSSSLFIMQIINFFTCVFRSFFFYGCHRTVLNLLGCVESEHLYYKFSSIVWKYSYKYKLLDCIFIMSADLSPVHMHS